MSTEVKIGELKNRLSAYLRAVRKGQEIVIKDRETPIARLVPYERARNRLEVIPPTRSLKELDRLLASSKPVKGLKPEDVDEALRWVRRDAYDKFYK